MENEHIRIIEINGVKMEIDTRAAKIVDRFRVGDRVKVLVKRYGEHYDSHHGVIVAFDGFSNLPTITVCYIDSGDLKFAYINKSSEDTEICACNDDVLVEKAEVIGHLDSEISRKKSEVADLERKKAYFLSRFGALFGQEVENAIGK